jgi:hypothetical protein
MAMNKLITAIKSLDFPAVETMLQQDTKWAAWAEDDGKNALHYLGGVVVGDDQQKADASLAILDLLLKNGMDINAVHQIKDGCGFFPATPLWYAYTRGRNEKLYTHLLSLGADAQHCMFAIAWYNDVKAAALFKKHGAIIDDRADGDTPFMAAFNWRRFDVAEWFLQNGADVNAAGKDGKTALFFAVKRKYKTAQISLLLQYGADPDKENNEGISPKKLAEATRQQKILALFKT